MRHIKVGARIAALASLMVLTVAGQDLRPAPDFGQSSLASPSEEVSAAWKAWDAAARNLEQEISSLPMGEARKRIETAYSRMMKFLEKRKAYNEAVLACLDAEAGLRATKPAIGVNAVSGDAIELLGANLAQIDARLNQLRATPYWAKIRRRVNAIVSEILELQESRRRDIQVDRPSDRSGARQVSATAYRSTETEARDVIAKLWTHYYQALLEAVDPRTGASHPLTGETPPIASEGSSPAPRTVEGGLTGTWTYAKGSKQFNGIAEPGDVILELWMERGSLIGRYRAQLPDFDQLRSVDLEVRGKPAAGSVQTLEFHSSSPAATGKIVLEGPDGSGLRLMLVRVVEPGSSIPRGRELLNRR